MVSIVLPTVGGDSGTWGTELNTALTALVNAINAIVPTGPVLAGGTGSTPAYISKSIFEGSAVLAAQDDTGLTAEFATVIDTLTCLCAGAPVGGSTTIAIYKRGPSTAWALSGSPVATISFIIPVSGVTPHIASVGALAIPMQQYDALVSRVSAVGSTPATNITLVAHLNALATVPIPVGPPTAVTSTVTGQANNAALIAWTAPTIPTGQTPTIYTVVASNGQTATVAYGTNSLVFTGLPASALTFYVFLTTSASGASLAGTSSASTTPAVTPAGGVTTRLTANELKGQDWVLNGGPGTYAFASGTNVTGSGQTGSMLLTATGSGAGVDAGTVARHSVTVGEVKTIGGWFKNNSAGAVLIAVWLSFQDGSGSYAGDSTVTQQSLAAGATVQYSTSSTVPGGAATAILAAQFIPNGSGDSVNVSGMAWPV